MDNSPLIRFRVDREIGERAHRMAAQMGLELPDIMRMMLTAAVRAGKFSVDPETSPRTGAPTQEQLDPYEPRYWSEVQATLDADLALALLHHVVAACTTWLDKAPSVDAREAKRLEHVRADRDEARALLAAFDPRDAALVARVFERFPESSEPATASKASP